MKKGRLVGALVVCLIASMLLNPAVISGSAGDAPDSIVLWTLDFEAFYNPQASFAEAFTAETGINVKVEMVADYWNKAAAAISSGAGPDAIYWMARNMYPYFIGGKLVPMPDTMVATPSDYWDGALGWWREGDTYYGLPNDYNYEGFTLLMINRGLLEENGFSIPDEWIANGAPGSYDELLEFAKSVTVTYNDRITIPGLVGYNDNWNAQKLIALIKQMGGDFTDEAAQKITFNTDIGRQALQFMYDSIAKDGIDSFDLGNGIDQFITNGRAMMAIAAPHWAAKAVTEQPDMDWVMLHFPPVAGDTPYFYADGGWGYAVLESSPNQEIAWEFIDYCLRPENDVQIVFEGSMVPARKELQNSPLLLEDELGKRFYPPAMQVLEYGVACPSWVIDSGYMADMCREYMQKVYAGEMDVESALQTVDELCNEQTAKLQGTYR